MVLNLSLIREQLFYAAADLQIELFSESYKIVTVIKKC